MNEIDDQHNGKSLITFIRHGGTQVTYTRDRSGRYHLEATGEDGQQYRMTGDELYPLAVELALQLGYEDMD